MFEDLDPTVIGDFKGLYLRGDNADIPPGYSLICQDCDFRDKSVRFRPTFICDTRVSPNAFPAEFTGNLNNWDTALPTKHIRKVFSFSEGENALGSKLVSTYEGNIYLCKSSGAPTLLLTLANWSGFFIAIQYRDKIFLNPIPTTPDTYTQNGIYVWQANNFISMRLAGGAGPATAATLAIAGTAGTMDAGTHIVAVAYETNSGFVTAPGPVATIVVTAIQKIAVTNIPLGPAGTVARHLLVSRAITTYSGNPKAYPLYYQQKINDNTTTTATIDGYDTALVESADYLLDERTTIPNCRMFSVYDDRLVLIGNSMGATERQVVMISNPGEPESFATVDNSLIVVTSGYTGPLAAASIRGLLYLFTDTQTYVTQDNGDFPANWAVSLVDNEVGVIPNWSYNQWIGSFSIATISGVPVVINDNIIVMTNRGALRLFNGSYGDELSYNIATDTYTPLPFLSQWQWMRIWVNPRSQEIWIVNKYDIDDPTNNYVVFYANFKDGLSSDRIKWSIWSVGYSLTPIYNGHYTREFEVTPQFDFDLVGVQGMYRLDYGYVHAFKPNIPSVGALYPDTRDHKHDGTTVALASTYSFSIGSHVIEPNKGWISQWCGISAQARATYKGNLVASLVHPDIGTEPTIPAMGNHNALVLKTPWKGVKIPFNDIASMAVIQLGFAQTPGNYYTEFIDINSFVIYTTPLWVGGSM